MRTGLIAALDVGTSKVACFIAHAGDDGRLEVLGVGHQRAQGMRNGQVVNMDRVEAAIRAAVEGAEQMAGQRIDSVLLSVNSGQPHSTRAEIDLALDGHEIRDSDVARVLDHARALSDGPERDLIHCIPTTYTIDGGDGIVDPRGMFGQRLGVHIHLVTAAAGPVRNLALAVERAHLAIEGRVVAPYASGLSCLVEDEREMGAILIDIGGGTTSFAVFLDNQMVFVDSLPVGGNHVTNDIAKGLSTPLANAERLKTVYGNCLPSPSDQREFLKVPLVGEDEESSANEVPRSMLINIIRPRLEETLELVRHHLEHAGLSHVAGRRVVLTGGGSQLSGIRELAEMVLDKQVRLAQPQRLLGLPDSVGGPAFATAAGLLRYGQKVHVEAPAHPEPARRADGSGGRLGRLGRWLKENF
ncbi:cell division protein FtsA [Roseospirillum parvum]|uniref:Cell division protein FtsA n=2 Tax=Roseospirillum parvum TaxID=83401 RepID=A0A1G7UAH8_9PROT|nr:cell division protein FtsA [Roseospirillum parvum]SDG44586.1 cell division protein FtsA [Roseospirillum parvum]